MGPGANAARLASDIRFFDSMIQPFVESNRCHFGDRAIVPDRCFLRWLFEFEDSQKAELQSSGLVPRTILEPGWLLLADSVPREWFLPG